MRGAAEREWLDLVADLLGAPLHELPVERLALQLVRAFDGVGCGFSVARAGEPLAGELHPRDEDFDGHRAEIERWAQREAWRAHPLLVHTLLTGHDGVLQVADVPAAVVGTRVRDTWYGLARRWGCPEQLAIPVARDEGGARTFVVGRDRPFTPRELELARRVQRLLRGLDAQVRALAGRGAAGACRASDLTPREVAVLGLLADGLTAAAIGRRLAIRERTVHKHLEHAYSKLHVTDRLSAVLRAQHAGVLPTR